MKCKDEDIVSFELMILDLHRKVLADVDNPAPVELSRRMARVCTEMAEVIRRGDRLERVAKLTEMYDLFREFGYDVPN